MDAEDTAWCSFHEFDHPRWPDPSAHYSLCHKQWSVVTWSKDLYEKLSAAAGEGRNVQPPGENWTDDQASAVEGFAMQLLHGLGWFDEWMAGR